ncbi:probable G-protein coupled receptor 139 [Heterodontus francisci]|uniref:probable G-protein coupled receptor 139 n=1 Tax=Heterodontus francisci TaxID=7792 RepID=UPI00355B08DB
MACAVMEMIAPEPLGMEELLFGDFPWSTIYISSGSIYFNCTIIPLVRPELLSAVIRFTEPQCFAFVQFPCLEVSLIDRAGFQSVISSLFPLLSLTVNLLGIVILSRGKCGLSTCTTRYLVAMATADLLVIITELILYQINYYYFPLCFLSITPVCSVCTVLRFGAMHCSVWFTVTFTFDRFVAICCQKLKTKYCTGKTAALVLTTTCILLCLKDIPFYFTYEPREIINNVPWFCSRKLSYYTEPRWVGFAWFDTVLTPLLPFALILLLNTLTVRHILVASRVRKGLRGQSKGESHSDPEMESRRKSVILLFTISGSFILLWLVFVIEFLYHNITGTDPGDYNDSLYIFRHVGFMLLNLSCCTNTFIYGVTQSKFREQFMSAVKYPVTSIIQLMNKQNKLQMYVQHPQLHPNCTPSKIFSFCPHTATTIRPNVLNTIPLHE